MSETITSIKLDGNNNVVIQSVNNSQVTVQTVNWDDFVKKYTIEQRERIAELQKLLNRTEKLYGYERLELSQKINYLQKQLDDKEAQIKSIIESYKDKDLSDANTSPLYREALALFLNGKTDAVLELLSEAKLEEEERKTAELRILKAQALQLEYRFEEAAVNYEKAVAIAPTGENHFESANFYQFLNQFDKAKQHYEQAIQKVNNDADRAMTLNNVAILYKKQNEYAKAEKSYDEALALQRDLAQTNPTTFLYDVAGTLNNLSLLYYNQNEYGKAEKGYDEALEIRRRLVQTNPATFLPDVAMTLNNLSLLYAAQTEYGKAEKGYDEALEIRRNLAQTNPATFLPDVAGTLNNLSLLYYNQNDFAKAEKGYDEALEIYRNLAKTNPATFLPYVAITLNNLAVLYSPQNEFTKAEEGYDEALAIYRGLAQTNPATFLPDVAMTLNNLASLYFDQNDFSKAEKGYDEALEIYRNLAKTNPATFLPDVAMTAVNMSIFYRESYRDREKSVAFAKEALQSASPFIETVPSVLKNAEKAMRILTIWGINAEALLKDIKNGTQEEKENFDWDELVKNVHTNRNTNNIRMSQNVKTDSEPRKSIFAAVISYLRRLF
jgi:tetratricopeptide (TPR) repeat protein